MSCTRYWAPGVRVVWTPRGDWKDGARIRVTGGWGEETLRVFTTIIHIMKPLLTPCNDTSLCRLIGQTGPTWSQQTSLIGQGLRPRCPPTATGTAP